MDDFQKLRSEMRACKKCTNAGYFIHPKAIFAGKITANTMVIGQAPGVTEVEAGRPFNAGSGSRLFQWLTQAGFDEHSFRAQEYMTSVTKCFPGKSKEGSGDRVPSREEQALCRPFLDSEIHQIQPKMIIPVGRLAINLFFPARDSLTAIIGTERRENGVWIVPLPHPSGASRWHQTAENRALIDKAIARIARHRVSIYSSQTQMK
jgi:uracil-DNA glycosylase